MSKRLRCSDFRAEQFVQVRQVRAVYSVYIASRKERMQNKGLGCAVTDLLTGETQKMRVSDLAKMQLRGKDNKTGKYAKVRAKNLENGGTYILSGNPNLTCLAFIVPMGDKYEYATDSMQLKPSDVIISYDGKHKHYIRYAEFRKMFVMLPNPVSSGAAKQQGFNAPQTPRVGIGTQQAGFVVQSAPVVPQRQSQAFGAPQTTANRSSGMSSAAAALSGLDPNASRVQTQQQPEKKGQFTICRQIYYQGHPWGYELTDGTRFYDVSEAECIKNVASIRNAKSVSQGNGSYLQGLGGTALRGLPIKQM